MEYTVIYLADQGINKASAILSEVVMSGTLDEVKTKILTNGLPTNCVQVDVMRGVDDDSEGICAAYVRREDRWY